MDVSDSHMQREKARARELRKSRWWQSLIAKATCYYCQTTLAKSDVTMDHVVPVGQGGKSTPGNIVPACKACNTRKRDMTAVEWQLWQLDRQEQAGQQGRGSDAARAKLHEVGHQRQK